MGAGMDDQQVDLLHQLMLGAVCTGISVTIQTAFMSACLEFLRELSPSPRGYVVRSGLMAAVVVWFFLSICVQCWAWAMAFIWLDALEGLEQALYFATVTFTTVGYGDVVLTPEWRLLGAFTAANGTIVIGWTTALVFVAVQRLFFVEGRD